MRYEAVSVARPLRRQYLGAQVPFRLPSSYPFVHRRRAEMAVVAANLKLHRPH